MVLQLARFPLKPGLPAPEQWKAGRKEPATFEMFERKIRDQLGRMLSAGGFDPARDIEAITVNRWSGHRGDHRQPLVARLRLWVRSRHE
jgi:spermidine dehydrogenase